MDGLHIELQIAVFKWFDSSIDCGVTKLKLIRCGFKCGGVPVLGTQYNIVKILIIYFT